MELTLNGMVSVRIDDEWLFEAKPLPVSFECELAEENVRFENGKAKMSFMIPVELSVPEEEWSRVVGELLAKMLYAGAGPDSSSP
ncbi:MAG TPA: hypothetical protein VNE62_09200 [Actinomycetota bacterium]|nr:hypothetical protein [Actinomycetota bacterium]